MAVQPNLSDMRRFNKPINLLGILVLLLGVLNSCAADKTVKPPIIKVPEKQRTFFVSPAGSDLNPGTKTKPWKTLAKVTVALKAGDTAVFEDGEYLEKGIVTFEYGGEIEKPIVVMARNKHKARIIFPASARHVQKINIQEKEFIEIKYLEITQEERSYEKTTDIFIRVTKSKDCSFIENKIYFCLEEGIKISGDSKNMLIDGNEISDTQHEGIDVLNVENVIIRNNIVEEVERVGIMVKGGARNVQVYNNIVRNRSKTMRGYGFTIGGETNNTSPYDITNKGYEAYNVFVWNNVIIAQSPGQISNGIAFIGAKDCHVYNNVIIGTNNGIYFSSPPGIKNGWYWDPVVENPVIKNNIIMNIAKDAFFFKDQPVNLQSDYNLFYNVLGNEPMEPNSIYADPLFIDIYNNWRTQSSSPAIGSGKKLPTTFKGFNEIDINIKFSTFDSEIRKSPWSMGIYN